MDVAGSLPVGRSISECIVAVLLDDEVEDFFARNTDVVNAEMISKNLRDSGFQDRWHLVDGIEIYGLCVEDDVQLRCERHQATFYGVSLHLKDGGLYDVGDFATPEAALAAARFIKKRIKKKVHWIDEISESADEDEIDDPIAYIDATFSPVCKAVDLQRDLHEAGFTNIRVFKGGMAGQPPEYAYVEAWMTGLFFNVRKAFKRILTRHHIWNMQLPPDPKVRSGKWNKEGWVSDANRNLKHVNRRCHIYIPPWAIDFDGHSPL